MRPIIIILVATVIMFSIISIVPAASKSEAKIDSSVINKLYKSCSRETKSELELAQCLWDVKNKSERYLQKLEKTILNKLDSDEKSLFIKASKAWQQFVNLTCQYDTNGLGSMAGSVNSSCNIRLHLTRIEALENYKNCFVQEDCGVPLLLHMKIAPEN